MELTVNRKIYSLNRIDCFRLASVVSSSRTVPQYVLALWWKDLPALLLVTPNQVCSYPCSPEVQSILKISQPQEPELMNANPSPPVSRFYSV